MSQDTTGPDTATESVSALDRRGFLRKAGIGTASLVSATGVAVAEAEKYDDHSWSVSIYDAMQGYDITVSWQWDWDDSGDATQPHDGVGIYWDDDKFEVLNADYGHTDTVEFDNKGVNSGNEGVSWIHDQAAALQNYDPGTTFNATTKISPNSGFDTYPVYAEFHHTWNDTDIVGLGLEAYGFSIKWENDGESWDKAEDEYVNV